MRAQFISVHVEKEENGTKALCRMREEILVLQHQNLDSKKTCVVQSQLCDYRKYSNIFSSKTILAFKVHT